MKNKKTSKSKNTTSSHLTTINNHLSKLKEKLVPKLSPSTAAKTIKFYFQFDKLNSMSVLIFCFSEPESSFKEN